jgi:LPS-assembly lipoprotein
MKFLLSAFMLLTLAACGFSPMYGSGAGSNGLSGTAGMDQVGIALIPDETGVYLRNILIDRFYQDGYPSAPRYALKIQTIQKTINDLDITVDSESTRRQIKMATSFTLVDSQTSTSVLSRNVTALTSYNVLGSQFTTRISEADAREAALADLARQIETQVVLYFKK